MAKLIEVEMKSMNGIRLATKGKYVDADIKVIPKIYTAGTEDLSEGVSELETGTLYILYE